MVVAEAEGKLVVQRKADAEAGPDHVSGIDPAVGFRGIRTRLDGRDLTGDIPAVVQISEEDPGFGGIDKGERGAEGIESAAGRDLRLGELLLAASAFDVVGALAGRKASPERCDKACDRVRPAIQLRAKAELQIADAVAIGLEVFIRGFTGGFIPVLTRG